MNESPAGQSDLRPEQFRPMSVSETARYLKVSVRTLEAWRQRTAQREDAALGVPQVSADAECV